MTNQSYICQELASIIETEKLTVDTEHVQLLNVFRERHLDIKVKTDLPLAIFNYSIEADFTNPVVQEARGIIINLDTLTVVCWPFRKFGRYDESYADTIDWSTAQVQEKIDGSIIKLWFNRLAEEWQFSSNSMINAADAIINENTGLSLMDIIKRTPEYGGFENGRFFGERELDKDYTYILELTSPDNRVVVPYTNDHLSHTGTRNNLTGEETKGYIGLRGPIYYDIHTIKDCIEYATRMNEKEDGVVSAVENEGFVVVDGNWNRIKVKSPEYMIMHHIVSITKESKKQLVQLLLDRKLDISGLAKCFPNLAHILYFYAYQVSEMEYNATSMINISRRLFVESGHDRKSVALKIKKDKYAPFGFAAINDVSVDPTAIIHDFGFAKLIKYIPDYETGGMRYLLVRDDVEHTTE